jgi:hypothetical protein
MSREVSFRRADGKFRAMGHIRNQGHFSESKGELGGKPKDNSLF